MKPEIKYYSLEDDKLVLSPSLSAKQIARRLGRTITSIYARRNYLSKKVVNKSDSDLAIRANKQSRFNSKPINFTMNGVRINISGVKSLDINNNNINIQSH
jgi:hypothetical protein